MILTIFGYPKTGKTSLYNILTGLNLETSKFSATTSESHQAIVEVPDERLARLAALFDTPPVYARIEYFDTGQIAFGESKSSTFLDLLRRGDGLLHVVRAFEDPEIPHPMETIDPLRDMQRMEEELCTVDYLSVEKRLERLAGEIRKTRAKELIAEEALLQRFREHLEAQKPLRTLQLSPEERHSVRGFSFLSLKPLLHLVNADEDSYQAWKSQEMPPENGVGRLVFCARLEAELLDLDPEDRKVFQDDFGLGDYRYIRDRLLYTSYRLLDLQSFFTVGSDETRAWTIPCGATAWEAAGKIHSDIQKGFIRAEAIAWDLFLEAGSFPAAKDKGLLRLEGKEYLPPDGEILHFRFNK